MSRREGGRAGVHPTIEGQERCGTIVEGSWDRHVAEEPTMDLRTGHGTHAALSRERGHQVGGQGRKCGCAL